MVQFHDDSIAHVTDEPLESKVASTDLVLANKFYPVMCLYNFPKCCEIFV